MSSVLIKIELKIKSWGKQNRDFDLELILSEVAISTSMLEIEHKNAVLTLPNTDSGHKI